LDSSSFFSPNLRNQLLTASQKAVKENRTPHQKYLKIKLANSNLLAVYNGIVMKTKRIAKRKRLKKRRIASELLAQYGRKGGKSTFKQHGSAFFRKISFQRKTHGGGRPKKIQSS
jgi:hypothetical protein